MARSINRRHTHRLRARSQKQIAIRDRARVHRKRCHLKVNQRYINKVTSEQRQRLFLYGYKPTRTSVPVTLPEYQDYIGKDGHLKACADYMRTQWASGQRANYVQSCTCGRCDKGVVKNESQVIKSISRSIYNFHTMERAYNQGLFEWQIIPESDITMINGQRKPQCEIDAFVLACLFGMDKDEGMDEEDVGQIIKHMSSECLTRFLAHNCFGIDGSLQVRFEEDYYTPFPFFRFYLAVIQRDPLLYNYVDNDYVGTNTLYHYDEAIFKARENIEKQFISDIHNRFGYQE